MAISVYCLVLMLYPEGITCGYVDFRSSTEFFCKIAIGISFVNGMLGTFFKNIWEKLFKTLSIVAIICLAMFSLEIFRFGNISIPRIFFIVVMLVLNILQLLLQNDTTDVYDTSYKIAKGGFLGLAIAFLNDYIAALFCVSNHIINGETLIIKLGMVLAIIFFLVISEKGVHAAYVYMLIPTISLWIMNFTAEDYIIPINIEYGRFALAQFLIIIAIVRYIWNQVVEPTRKSVYIAWTLIIGSIIILRMPIYIFVNREIQCYEWDSADSSDYEVVNVQFKGYIKKYLLYSNRYYGEVIIDKYDVVDDYNVYPIYLDTYFDDISYYENRIRQGSFGDIIQSNNLKEIYISVGYGVHPLIGEKVMAGPAQSIEEAIDISKEMFNDFYGFEEYYENW